MPPGTNVKPFRDSRAGHGIAFIGPEGRAGDLLRVGHVSVPQPVVRTPQRAVRIVIVPTHIATATCDGVACCVLLSRERPGLGALCKGLSIAAHGTARACAWQKQADAGRADPRLARVAHIRSEGQKWPKRHKRKNRRRPWEDELKRRSPDAVSTGQAARFCYVTPETIVNWIRSNQLRAQRTAGGQYRIRTEELREFMTAKGMATALLDAERDVRPYCWEYHCEEAGRFGSVCDSCLVHRSGTLNCWELHGLLPLTSRRVDRCANCDYFQRYGSHGHE
ncbi:MAG: helix-turn-helix domain-containing protein [Acidobacteriota bacterium]